MLVAGKRKYNNKTLRENAKKTLSAWIKNKEKLLDSLDSREGIYTRQSIKC